MSFEVLNFLAYREICASKSGLIIFCPKRGRRDRHVQRTIECIMFFRGATVVVTTVPGIRMKACRVGYLKIMYGDGNLRDLLLN